MDLHPEEPSFEPFEPVSDDALVALVGPVRLVLVDGRSAGGKTTFGSHLAGLLGAAVVHTDDVAWNHSILGWDDTLVAGVIEPWRRGEPVDFRPLGWVEHDRPGSVTVPAGVPLVVEGVGAGRASLAPLADLVVWVQSDRTLARIRGIERDASYGTRTVAEAEEFWDHWMTEEEPHLAADRPWERAGLVVLTTPHGPGRTSGNEPALADSTTWVRDLRNRATSLAPTTDTQSDSSSA